ncbi:cotton fiber protein [Thalictrum thalictroides]|uniref:Cotton fiber protein n=1 Tax=Thalictrum thalictroides TaxID=46969 RepID=A0A7J6WFF0_THATH|nr:cotton fiber protein [Thalictrum thalictroides]
MWQVLRALTKMKSMVMQLLNKDKESSNTSYLDTIKKMKTRKKKKKFFSTITMHYNWCSNNSVIPMPQPEVVVDEGHSIHDYYDSTWNATLVEGEDYGQDGLGPQLSGYLQWLEEKVPENCTEDVDEIDKLADKFIASCHEKFRLEKQESYRRYQEMLARSM